MSKKQELQKLLKHKKSKEWYAAKLGTSIARVEELLDEIRGKEETGGVALEEVNVETGDRKVEYISTKPLSKEEIEELYGIDGIKSRLANYWNKQTPSGKYLVSALIKCTVEDFYSTEELAEKLKEIFPPLEAIELPYKKENDPSDKALFIYISDDHCGNDISNSIYGKEYSGNDYMSRLVSITDGIKKWDYSFDKVFVINLGDELDGWNGKTTRYDHDLADSLSNKKQFDIYCEGRKAFYDELFASGISDDYSVITLENSNHTGNGLSYIVNKALEFYVHGRYPTVDFSSRDKFIDYLAWGKHIIGLTHGKDEKLMKSPLPLNLDPKTDLWLFEYYDKLGISPSKYFVSTIKGDIHKFNVNTGKSGRYVNVPSIAGGSSWIELNFGDTRAGALLEIVDKGSPNIISMPIWFN